MPCCGCSLLTMMCAARGLAAQFVEPMVYSISGSHCSTAVMELANTGEPFSTLQPGCYQAMYNAVLSTALITIVSWIKVRTRPPRSPALPQLTVVARGLQMPELLEMLRKNTSPPGMEGAVDDGRWSGIRCCGEWFSLLFLISYHVHQEHPVVSATPAVSSVAPASRAAAAFTPPAPAAQPCRSAPAGSGSVSHGAAVCCPSLGDVVGAADPIRPLHNRCVLRHGGE